MIKNSDILLVVIFIYNGVKLISFCLFFIDGIQRENVVILYCLILSLEVTKRINLRKPSFVNSFSSIKSYCNISVFGSFIWFVNNRIIYNWFL